MNDSGNSQSPTRRPRGRTWRRLAVAAALLAVATGLPAQQPAGPPHGPPPDRVLRTPPPSADIPPTFAAWWERRLSEPLGPPPAAVPVDPEGLVMAALMHSAQVRVFRDTVAVSQSAICETLGKFDPRAFAESKFVDTSDPVGSTLTTGGPPRWIDENWYAAAGLRKTCPTGAQLEVSQRIGYEDSNSLDFLPPNQDTARLRLCFTQPLLNGAGRAYNTSLTVLAEINSNIARDRFTKDLQALMVDIHRAYWDLYLNRAALLQRRRLLDQAGQIRAELVARRHVDVLEGQLVRADAAVANREAAVIRYQAAVQNTEARLRALVNDPGLAGPNVEMVPRQPPIRQPMPVDLNDSLVMALHARPELQQGLREVRAAGVRASAAANEVLPVLNAIIETYVSGLEEGQLGRAYADQFTLGRPTYAGGLQFEVPLGGNRTANARLNQRQIELRQATAQLEATTANVRAEVEIAVRDVVTAYRETVSKYHATIAGEAEIRYLTSRWRALPGDQQNAGYALDELLSAQERLAQSEFDFAAADACYNVALVALARVTGTLAAAQSPTVR